MYIRYDYYSSCGHQCQQVFLKIHHLESFLVEDIDDTPRIHQHSMNVRITNEGVDDQGVVVWEHRPPRVFRHEGDWFRAVLDDLVRPLLGCEDDLSIFCLSLPDVILLRTSIVPSYLRSAHYQRYFPIRFPLLFLGLFLIFLNFFNAPLWNRASIASFKLKQSALL